MEAIQYAVSVPQWMMLKALGPVGRKLHYRGPLATARLVDVPEPLLPGPEWVRIATMECGVCASDMNLIFLKESATASPFTSFPCIMGHEICGRVMETGPNVTRVKAGDVVVVSPGLTCQVRGIDPMCPACAAGRLSHCENYAQGNLAPGMFIGICRDTGGGFGPRLVAHESQLFHLPPELTPDEGVLMEPLSVAIEAVHADPPPENGNVLVIGGGVVGSLIVQALRALGYSGGITVSDPSPVAAELCRQAGADMVLEGDLYVQAADITGAIRYKPLIGAPILMGGFSRIYDTVGSQTSLNTSLRCLAAGGSLAVVGLGPEVNLDLTPLWLKGQRVFGVYGCGRMTHNGEDRHMFEVALDLAVRKTVKLGHMVTHKLPLDQFERLIDINLDKTRHGAIKTAVVFAES